MKWRCRVCEPPLRESPPSTDEYGWLRSKRGRNRQTTVCGVGTHIHRCAGISDPSSVSIRFYPFPSVLPGDASDSRPHTRQRYPPHQRAGPATLCPTGRTGLTSPTGGRYAQAARVRASVAHHKSAPAVKKKEAAEPPPASRAVYASFLNLSTEFSTEKPQPA